MGFRRFPRVAGNKGQNASDSSTGHRVSTVLLRRFLPPVPGMTPEAAGKIPFYTQLTDPGIRLPDLLLGNRWLSSAVAAQG